MKTQSYKVNFLSPHSSRPDIKVPYLSLQRIKQISVTCRALKTHYGCHVRNFVSLQVAFGTLFLPYKWKTNLFRFHMCTAKKIPFSSFWIHFTRNNPLENYIKTGLRWGATLTNWIAFYILYPGRLVFKRFSTYLLRYACEFSSTLLLSSPQHSENISTQIKLFLAPNNSKLWAQNMKMTL